MDTNFQNKDQSASQRDKDGQLRKGKTDQSQQKPGQQQSSQFRSGSDNR